MPQGDVVYFTNIKYQICLSQGICSLMIYCLAICVKPVDKPNLCSPRVARLQSKTRFDEQWLAVS